MEEMEKNLEINMEEDIIFDKGLPRGFIITDKNLVQLYPEILNRRDYFIIEDGENSKDLKTYFKIINSVPNNTKTIIAFGGGVVGDITGFVASTYKRGIELIQIPTTLLAMVDSSFGGKNGVNLDNKKNYIGTIYNPSKVLIDISFLKTLPQKEFSNGLAEVIKYSYLFGEPLLDNIDLKNMKKEEIKDVIEKCYKIKLEVVKKDLYDKNFRHVLNFGHTIGHAIERLYNLSHGEAISIGMVKELEIGARLGIVGEKESTIIKETLTKAGLITSLPKDFDLEKVLEVIKEDKKGIFVFSFTKDRYDIKVDEKVIRECLK